VGVMEVEGGGGGDGVDPGCLVAAMGSLQTVDQADLVRQMQRLVSDGSGQAQPLSESYAKFYLEMSNWNVHAAVGNFFDLGGGAGGGAAGIPRPQAPVPPPLTLNLDMNLLRDVTVGEGESVQPATDFTKTWFVSNPGPDSWPVGTTLKFVSGTNLLHHQSSQITSVSPMAGDQGGPQVPVPALAPGQQTEISLRMRSPEAAGIYESRWRMSSPTTGCFGDTIWVILTVEASGTMGLTQQMDEVHFQRQNQHPSPAATASPVSGSNPFQGPVRHPSQAQLMVADGLSPPSDPNVSARNILERSLNNSSHSHTPHLNGGGGDANIGSFQDLNQDEDMN